MNQELLAILEQIEREKGINKQVLIEAIESALVSAVRKTIKAEDAEDADIEVKLDSGTGEITAFVNKEETKSKGFGRIAAQIAKQVIIQKIREAEKDVVYKEFCEKQGKIVSGIVYRIDKNLIIVDLLGKAEAILPRRYLSSSDEFRVGERIRAYLLEVNKRPKGPQIVLSRTHLEMVKKLFELEVPEVFQDIVEIKSLARDPGQRTKIAVNSKDDKVDSVGACVGVRGARVRNIVDDLKGEKIDIIRWSGDPVEYIKAALSPAEIKEIVLNKKENSATVLVNEDQLSLAIGKSGGNVRLASQLTGWDLDIRTSDTYKAEKKKRDLSSLSGVGKKKIESLEEEGFHTVSDIAKASPEKLVKIKGFSKKGAEKLIEEAKKNLERKE